MDFSLLSGICTSTGFLLGKQLISSDLLWLWDTASAESGVSAQDVVSAASVLFLGVWLFTMNMLII
ncbi:unnamed protein product [marine sediment metagenome]|uniref:Uncharacterized protein n=1 Tax=marine sediment metagenome TaxID=412755 RepID=X1CS03_9ZZZZ